MSTPVPDEAAQEGESAPPPAVWVQPEPDTRLEQLAAEYDEAKRAKDEAEKRLKTISDAIKLELQSAAPDQKRVVLNSTYLEAPLELVVKAGAWRVDAKRMKKEDPELYVQWARQDPPTVQLGRVRG